MKNYSDYWLGDILTRTTGPNCDIEHLSKLSSFRRVVSNFVHILTKKQYKVIFQSQGGQSRTDGKTVIISADLADTDITVGIALHEASHLLLSDFSPIRTIGYYHDVMIATTSNRCNGLDTLIPDSIREIGNKKGYTSPLMLKILKDFINIVEDRRIDNYVYKSAPGYRGYYESFYDKYFRSKLVDKGFKAKRLYENTVDSYLFHICNMMNKNANPKALPGLQDITNLIDLKNIGRLNNTNEVIDIAKQVLSIVMINVVDLKSPKDGESNSDQSGESNSDQSGESNSESNQGQSGEKSESDDSKSDSESDDSKSDSKSDSESDDSKSDSESDDSNSGSEDELDKDDPETKQGKSKESENSESESKGSESENSESESKGSESENSEPDDKSNENSELDNLEDLTIEEFEDIIDKLRDQINPDIDLSKESISEEDQKELQNLEQSNSDLVEVRKEMKDNSSKCLVYNTFNKAYIDAGINPMVELSESYFTKSAVEEGLKMGTSLGRKLQIRGEERETMYNRQNKGRVDKRMIASAGFGYENIFNRSEIEKYQSAVIHISVDASGSMGGTRWSKAIATTVAIAKAGSMVDNMRVTISFRGNKGRVAAVLMAYDSKVDSIQKIKDLFPHLVCDSLTPEGLCFEAILKQLSKISAASDTSYFVNISDGQPAFGNYSGYDAIDHTRIQVNKIRAMGMKVLSYFVGRGNTESPNFIHMYGKSASFIDVSNVTQIAKTMNKLMLQK